MNREDARRFAGVNLIRMGPLWVLDGYVKNVGKAGFLWHKLPCGMKSCPACKYLVGARWWTHLATNALKLSEYAADGETMAILKATAERLDASRAADSSLVIPAPPGKVFRPFQRAGVAYAMRCHRAIIADEMGLGKTIQALGVINLEPTATRVLVLCPANLKINWRNEAAEWLVEHWHTRIVTDLDSVMAAVSSGMRRVLVIASIELTRNPIVQGILMANQWDVLVVDEAHRLMNHETLQSKAILGKDVTMEMGKDGRRHKVPAAAGISSRAARVLHLTGTPIDKRPADAFGLLHDCDPREFHSRSQFTWRYKDATYAAELQQRARASCMVRRLKKDVAKELPPKIRQLIVLEQDARLRAVVEHERRLTRGQTELEDEADILHALGDEDAFRRTIGKLRDTVRVAFQEMSLVRHEMARAKVPHVLEHVRAALEESDDPIAVWAHHVDVLESLRNGLSKYGGALAYHGGITDQRARDRMVQDFQAGRVRVFCAGITAAGVGLTLTAASHAVFAEQDWRPLNITQAEDRHHRIGQENSVLIQHLVVEHSLDARMCQTLIWKQTVAEKCLDEDERALLLAEPVSTGSRPKVYPVRKDAERDAAKAALPELVARLAGRRLEAAKELADRASRRPLTDSEVWLVEHLRKGQT